MEELILDFLEIVPEGGVLREEVNASLVADSNGLSWLEDLLAETQLELPLVSCLGSFYEIKVLFQIRHEDFLLTLYPTLQISYQRCLAINALLHELQLVHTWNLVVVSMTGLRRSPWVFMLRWH